MKTYLVQFIIYAFLFSNSCYAQSPLELASNEMKYWKMRGRLIGDEFKPSVQDVPQQP